MFIYNYFLEIKNRILLLVLAVLSVVLVSYVYKEILLFKIMYNNVFSLTLNSESYYFIFTDATEIISGYVTIVLFFSNQILVLYSVYHILFFISPGLYKSEYKNLSFLVKAGTAIFFISNIMFHNILFPLSWNFFLSFQHFSMLSSLTLHFEARLHEFLSFYTSFYFIFILYFQIFILFFWFFDNVKNDLQTIKSFRKIFYCFFVIISTVTTPPDVFSQLLLSLCFVFSYEIFIFYILINNLVRQPIKTD